MENLTEEKVNQEVSKIIPEIQVQSVSLFGTKDVFEHSQRVALMLSKSDLVPKQFQGNVGNCIIALEMAVRIGASPLMIMQNLYVVHGKPAWSSSFLIATVNACGKFSPLRYEEGKDKGGCVRAWATDKSNGERLNGAWVSMEMANAEGWVSKSGSKWKTMPELMMRYRAATFFARQFCPEISMGIHTTEEIQDIAYTPVKTTFEEVEALYEMKKHALSDAFIKDADRILKGKEEKSYQKLYNELNK